MIEALLSGIKSIEYPGEEKIKAKDFENTSIEIDGQEINKRALFDYSGVLNEQVDKIKSLPLETLRAINEQMDGFKGNEVTEKNDAGAESSEVSISELVDEYLKQLKELSPCPETIDDAVDMTNLEKLPPEEVAKRRSEFNSNREKLIREWEEKNGREWPTYKEDIYDKNGNIVRKAGDKMEAHHIKPLSLGGENTAENITPMDYRDHNDHKGIHASDSPYSRIISTVKENQ